MTDGDLGDLDMIRKTQKEKRTWVAAGAKNNLQKELPIFALIPSHASSRIHENEWLVLHVFSSDRAAQEKICLSNL